MHGRSVTVSQIQGQTPPWVLPFGVLAVYPEVAGSIPGYSSPSDETTNRGSLTIFQDKLLTRTYCGEDVDYTLSNLLSRRDLVVRPEQSFVSPLGLGIYMIAKAGIKFLNLTFDESRQCRGCAGVPSNTRSH